MDPTHFLIEETNVRSFEGDFKGKWKPACFIQVMIEAASHHASRLGFGFDHLMAQNMVWVLSRVKVRFIRFPTFGQKVIIKTWPKGIQQRLFFMRDFDLRGEEGQPIAVASFAWLLINPHTRRLVAPQTISGSLPDNDGIAALDEQLEKLNIPEGLPENRRENARYSDVDILGHATAYRYVEWVCDCFPLGNYSENQIDWLQINYINEIRPGGNIQISVGSDTADEKKSLVLGNNLETGLKAFESVVRWK
jgi:medium-chain acyl-[acyl-carrier-protein] hydrolase